MKKLFLVILALLFLSPMAFAAATTGTFGDQNSSKVYRVSIDSDGVQTYATDTSILYPYKADSCASQASTLTAADSGRYISNTNTNGCTFTLPTAAPGMVFNIADGRNGGASGTKITVDTVGTGDKFLASISAVAFTGGQAMLSVGQTGDSVCVFSAVANQWSLCGQRGAWTNGG